SIMRLLQNRNKWREPFGAPLASPLASDEKSDGCWHGTRIRERFQVKVRSLELRAKIMTATKRFQNRAPCHMPKAWMDRPKARSNTRGALAAQCCPSPPSSASLSLGLLHWVSGSF